jgi:hypothetical protein
VKNTLKALFLVFGFVGPLLGASQAIPRFRGLNNADAAVLIGDDEAQDLQDVDFTDSGNGIKKRSGYSSFKTVVSSTHGVRGGYFFRDASGNDNLIASNNRSVYYQRNGGAYTAFITTDTIDSYYDFTDSQGFLYRATNNRDQFARWNGTTLTYYPSNPAVNQVEALADRLVLSGTTANPNRVYFSAQADFTTFTVGPLESDAFTEDVGLPGQSVTAIKTACLGVLIFTKDTTSLWTGTNQYDGRIDQVSNNVGTLQPGSVIQDGGITYWQAADNHWYGYDCSRVDKISRKIDQSDFVGFGGAVDLVTTTQGDFEAGSGQTGADTGLSATASSGDLLYNLEIEQDDTNTTTLSIGTGLFGQSFTAPYNMTVGQAYIWMRNFSGATRTVTFQIRDNNAGVPGNTVYSTATVNVTTTSAAELWSMTFSPDVSLTSGTVYWLYGNSPTTSLSAAWSVGDVYSGGTYWNSAVGSFSSDSTFAIFSTSITYLSQAQATTGISYFGTFDVTNALDSGTITYAVYTDTDTSMSVTNATTFISSQTITNGQSITATASTYVRWAAIFNRTAYTQTPSVSDVTITYNTGSNALTSGLVDKDHRLIWTVVEQGQTLPSASMIYDQRFGSWTKYSFPMSAAVSVLDTIYFGDTAAGNVYRFPSGESDAGSAITAYWQSKDFVSGDPFTEKTFNRYSFIGKASVGSNLDITYSIDGLTGITNNESLADPISSITRQINSNLPSGTYGRLISWKFGNDDSNAPFEVYGFSYDYTPRGWRVLQ